MTIEALKLNIIQKIMNVEDITRLQKLTLLLLQEDSFDKSIVQQLAKPMRKRLDFEQIKKEQGFIPIDKQAFFQKLDNLQIEDLLKML